jgi:capsular polysaccharide biosynthesis protein
MADGAKCPARVGQQLLLITYRLKASLKALLRMPWRRLRRLPSRVALAFARTAVRVLPQIDIESYILYPPSRYCASTNAWVERYGRPIGAEFRPVDVCYTAIHSLPKTISSNIRQQLMSDRTYPCPDTFVGVIPHGRVLGQGLVITPDDQLIDDLSVDFGEPFEAKLARVREQWTWRALTKVEGRVAVLSTAGAMLYYHWLFQLLPRYELIKRSGIDLNSIDYFLVNSIEAPFQKESIKSLGIDNRKIIESTAIHYLRATSLIVPSVPLSAGCFPLWMRTFLRSTFLDRSDDNTRSRKRRVYISRRNARYRRVLNEGEVIRLLKQFGFEQVEFEALSIQQQAQTMASSDVIVAPHGGGLSNLVFCRPGTKVIEIFSPELVAGYFWKLSVQLGLDYYYLLGKGTRLTAEPNYEQSWDARTDIDVDLTSLGETLELATVSAV